MVLTVLLFIIGLVIIIKSGNWFVEASVWVAEITRIPKMLIGATVVSLATTLPEFFVSVIAVSNGATDLGIGNALGSIISNTGLILAISFILKPTEVQKDLFYKKAAIMFLSLAILFAASLDKIITAWESIPLFAMLIVFIYFNIHHVKKSSLGRQKEIWHIDTHRKTIGINVFKFIIGAAGIVLGAKLLVDSGTDIAASLGISDGIIGVTIVALGTSLPEFVTTITAIRKNESAMGIGNILGANILNITLILSTCALISKEGLIIGQDYIPMLSRITSRSVFIDMPVIGLMFLLLIVPPIIFKGKLKRLQGVFMLTVYIAFMVFIVLNI